MNSMQGLTKALSNSLGVVKSQQQKAIKFCFDYSVKLLSVASDSTHVTFFFSLQQACTGNSYQGKKRQACILSREWSLK